MKAKAIQKATLYGALQRRSHVFRKVDSYQELLNESLQFPCTLKTGIRKAIGAVENVTFLIPATVSLIKLKGLFYHPLPTGDNYLQNSSDS